LFGVYVPIRTLHEGEQIPQLNRGLRRERIEENSGWILFKKESDRTLRFSCKAKKFREFVL
jgi:hypothetical protein